MEANDKCRVLAYSSDSEGLIATAAAAEAGSAVRPPRVPFLIGFD